MDGLDIDLEALEALLPPLSTAAPAPALPPPATRAPIIETLASKEVPARLPQAVIRDYAQQQG